MVFAKSSSTPKTVPSKGTDLILQSAGSNENTFVNGELVSVLRKNVVFKYDDLTFKSESATWWRTKGIVQFTDKVFASRKGQSLLCNSMRYERSRDDLTATGNVQYCDSVKNLSVKGDRCRYDLKSKQCYLDGNPKVIQIDTSITPVETLSIVAASMIYDDSLKRVNANTSIILNKGKLKTTCDSAQYDSKSGVAKLRILPKMYYDEQQLKGDSVDLLFRNDTLRNAIISGNADGLYVEIDKRDTSRTVVLGDSMALAISPDGFMDSVQVYRNVRSTYTHTANTKAQNKVTGKEMLVSFADSSKIKQAKVYGNAVSNYTIEENNAATGTNMASGDTLAVWFNEGKATRLRVLGSVRGTYHPQ